MLPAQERTPRNLLIPRGYLDYHTGSVDGPGHPVDNFLAHRGSMAGRALLTYIKSASAKKRRRYSPLTRTNHQRKDWPDREKGFSGA